MKTQILFILSVLFLISVTHASNYLGSAPERGIIITVNPDKAPSKTGDAVLIKGTIKIVKKGSQNGNPHKNLLEEFKTQGIDIVGTFPSFAVDISRELNLEGVSGSEIRFSYQSKSLVADDLNQFSLKVYNNHTNKDVHKKLAVIQAKLERRLQLLANLKRKFEGGKATQNAIAAIKKEIAKLSSISSKITQKLNTNENLMAENTYALQVDSAISNYSNVSTVMNDFRFSVFSDIGTAFQGTKINLKSQILSLSQARVSSGTSVEEKDGYLAEFYFNGQKLSSQKIIEPRKNLDVVFNYQTEKLNPANANIFLVELYHLENGTKARKIGSLNYKVPVIADTVKPIWLSDSIPNQQDRYTQQLRPIRLKAQDSLSGIDPASFKLSLSSQNTTKDLSQFILYTMFNDGEIYEFTGDINPLDEGEYVLTAKVSDLAGNLADDYNITFYVDRTAPVVNTTLTNNTLTNKTSIKVPITVSDLSPTATDVYVNNELVMTSALKEFSTSATLTIEGNNTIRIESKDAAGNVASIQSFLIIRDSVAPTLVDNNPATYLTNVLPKSLTFNFSSNENLAFAEVNGNFAQIVSGSQIVYTRNYTSEGSITLNVKIRDAAGNETTNTFIYDLSFDNVAPTIQIGQHPTLTNQSDVLVHFAVTDEHATSTKITVNNSHLARISEKSFSYLIPLTVEGENEIKISVTDAAGNASTESVIKITKDTTPPQLLSSIPANAANIDSSSFNVSGLSSEKLALAKLNGNALTLDSSGKQISGTYVSNSQGQVTLAWYLEDLVGNSTTVEHIINIQQRLLNPELVMVAPSQDGLHLTVYGGLGATRANSQVYVSTGLFSFNAAKGISKPDGSFALQLDLFSAGQLKVTDTNTNEIAAMNLSYQVNTTISGLVLDTSGNPLPNVTIGIQGASITTVTNAAGAFQFNAGRTGDQTLIVDGSSVPQTTTGPSRQFFQTKISINIGIGQNNALTRPIYLQPLVNDGTQTQVSPNVAVTVKSPHAQGSALELPSNATIFPNGSSTGAISITEISADKSTIAVPAAAVPSKVLALEPSGTAFKQRVELTLPNDNELPPGTEMIIMSMNSQKGGWEVDGHAKVSDDGSSVVTTPGNGISHFSLVFAVPVKPLISEVANPNLIGIDISKGAMTTSIDLPFYTSLGKKVTPSMTYKSSWAKPTAVVTNMFDIPSQELNFEYHTNGNFAPYLYKYTYRYCGWRGWSWNCWNRSQDYLIESSIADDFTYKSAYVPDSIKSQFYISSVATDAVQYQDVSTASNSQQSNIPGTVFAQNVSSEVNEMAGIPNKSLISYGVNLINPETHDYFESGLYPTMARYQIKLKNITMTSYSRTVKTFVNGQLYDAQVGKQDSVTTKLLDDALPSDVLSNIIVQNKTKSPFGRGWDLNFAQKIINPANNQVVIEEENGDLSSYSINNSISTVLDGNTLGVSFSEVANLANWPSVLTQKTDATLSNFAVKIQGETSSASIVNLGKLTEVDGRIYNNRSYLCPQQNYSGTFTSQYHSYNVKAKIRDLVLLPDGTVFGTNAAEHSVFRFANSVYKKMTGVAQTDEESDPVDMPTAQIPSYCDARGILCGAGVNTGGATSCQILSPTYTGFGFYDPKLNTGVFPVGAFSGDNQNGAFSSSGQRIDFSTPNGFTYPVGMNSPKSMVLSPNGDLVIADTGNNRVRKINLTTNTISTIAGDGSNMDSGDDGPAINAKLFHPRGLAYDSQGNLYVSSENGYIRKIDQNGIITTFAGKPLGVGGILSNEAPAKSIALLNPSGMVFDDTNNYLYVADTGNNRAVRIDINTMLATNVAGTGQCSLTYDENVAALNASLCAPLNVGLDNEKNLIVVNSGRNKIQIVRFNNSSSGSIAFAPTNKDLSTLVKNFDGTWTRTYRDGMVAEFNAKGLQTSSRSKINLQVQFQYNQNDQIVAMTDPSGRMLSINYSGNKISSIVDPANRTTQFEFSGDFLAKVIFPDGSARRFSYDPTGLLTNDFDGSNKETKYEYNSHSRLNKVIAPNLHETVLVDIESQSIGNTALASSTLTGNGYRTVIEDESSNVEYVKDLNGFITAIKDPLGRVKKIHRDEFGNASKLINPDGSTTEYTYDPVTRDLLSTTDIQNNISTANTYDGFGHVTSFTDGKGLTYFKEYDSITGLLVKEKTPLAGQEISYTYNQKGQVTQQSTKHGTNTYNTYYSYDLEGRLSRIVNPDGKAREFEYDLAGNQTVIRTFTTMNNSSEVLYEYDSMNRLKNTTSAKGEVTSYTYSLRGELITVTDPKEKTTTYTYGNLINKVIAKDFSTGEHYSYEYLPNGSLTQETDPNGNIKKYFYDALKQIKRVELADDVLEYDYDYAGKMIFAKNKNSKIDYSRDSLGRVTQDKLIGQGVFATLNPLILDYSYDENNNKTKTVVNQSIEFNYEYDNLNRLTKIISPYSGNFNYDYDDFNRVTKLVRPNGETNYSYYNSNLLSRVEHKLNGVTKAAFEYDFDSRNLISQRRTISSIDNYNYDSNGQISSSQSSGQPNESYSYDSLGNRLTDSDGVYIYNENTQRLTEDYKYNYIYDNNGNLIAKNPKNTSQKAFRYEYSSRNQLKSVTTLTNPFGSAEQIVTFEYDVTGRRMRKTISNVLAPSSSSYTLYQYDKSAIILESKYSAQTSSSALVGVYTNGQKTDDVLAIYVPQAGVTFGKAKVTGNYYFLKDNIGTIAAIANSTGSVVQKYIYSSFGKILNIQNELGTDISSDPNIDNQFTFTGREFDKEINTYYYRARFYDAGIGRFLQQDPHPGYMEIPSTVNNKYTYATNNPISWTDPFGDDIFKDIGNFAVSLVVTALLPAILVVALVVAIFDPALGLSIAMMGFQFSVFGQVANYLITGSFATLDEYEGMIVVKDSMFGGEGAFTPGPVSFVGVGNFGDEELMRHEYGHHLQYKKYGGWGMTANIFNVAQSGGFECEAGQLSRDYFHPGSNVVGAPNYQLPYHGSYFTQCMKQGYR